MNAASVRLMTTSGRVLLTLIFLFAAAGKLLDFHGTAQDLGSRGVPFPEVALASAIALESVGALLILAGFHARLGALLLILFLVPTTLVMHDFWASEGNQRIADLLQFLKNLAILGGLLLVGAYGGGAWSLDVVRRRA
jgi:putative oxidoreductase